MKTCQDNTARADAAPNLSQSRLDGLSPTWVRRQQRRISCFAVGEGEPVVLLHGMNTSGLVWAAQISLLAPTGYYAIVPDLAAHGASEPVQRTFGLDDLVADLWAVMDAYSVQQAHLVGVSLGGTVALSAALEGSERVSSLTLVNSYARTDTPEFEALRSRWRQVLRAEDGPLRLLDEVWPMAVNEAFRASDEGARTHQAWRAVAAGQQGPALAHILEGIGGLNVVERLPTLKIPTLLIAGGNDPTAPLSRAMARTIPQSRLVELVGAQHLANVDSAAAFNGALMSFLQQHRLGNSASATA